MQSNRSNPKRVARKNEVREPSDLDSRYRKIGISAVAAAARYHGESQEPAPATQKPLKQYEDA